MFINILWVPVFVDFVLEHRLKLRYGVRIALSLSLWRYYIQGNIRPEARFLFAPFALVVTRRIQDWANSNFSNFFLLEQNFQNDWANSRRGETVFKWRSAEIQGENNPVYSSTFIRGLRNWLLRWSSKNCPLNCNIYYYILFIGSLVNKNIFFFANCDISTKTGEEIIRVKFLLSHR